MSILTRPTVVFAIVFGCFAVLIPRIFLPLFRTKTAERTHHFDDHLRQPSPPMPPNEPGDHIQHLPGSPPHMRGAHPNMRMHHPGANHRQQSAPDQSSSKSIVTLALPMYTVGIGVFFVYTCCKYWSKKNTGEGKCKKPQSDNGLLWRHEKRELQCDILDKDSEGEEESKQEFYTGLDPDYLEYLKAKKQKALDAEQMMTDEQKQMHHALEEMKKSLSFISSKLVTKENRGNLGCNEINQLQERLASTEAQMCSILTALDAASNRVSGMTKKSKTMEKRQSVEKESVSSSDEEGVPNPIDDDEDHHSSPLSSGHSSATEDDDDQSPPIIE